MRKVTLRLDDDEWMALRRLADIECRTMNAEVRKLIRDKAAAKGVFTVSRPTLKSVGNKAVT